MAKEFIDAETLLAESFRLAARIHASGYRPDLLLGVWRGGAPIAIAVHEYLQFRGHGCEHLPVRVSSYTGIGVQSERIDIHGLPWLLEQVAACRRLLIVDDVLDTGRSLAALLAALAAAPGERELRTACPWYKPGRNRCGRIPDYYLHETDNWLVFPHELAGLDDTELRAGKGRLADLLLDDPAGP
ncbi:MAG: phosphoribosyltransferase [Pseudomonadota bacterium]